MLYWISAQFYVGSVSSGFKSGMGDLHWLFLVLNSLLDQLNVLLHIENFLKYLWKEIFIAVVSSKTREKGKIRTLLSFCTF